MTSVKFIHATLDAEDMIVYCARVSSLNQDTENKERLIRYCLKRGHWSIFEMASMCVEIQTSRAIAQQILRHRSFSFQEFSQRYADVAQVLQYPARRQAEKNRQSSVDDLPKNIIDWFQSTQTRVNNIAQELYKEALQKGIARESARFLLPLATATRLYMHGTMRSWIHYLKTRLSPDTQVEHRDIAEQIASIFKLVCPIIWNAIRDKEAAT